jgi:hypothetical protein
VRFLYLDYDNGDCEYGEFKFWIPCEKISFIEVSLLNDSQTTSKTIVEVLDELKLHEVKFD